MARQENELIVLRGGAQLPAGAVTGKIVKASDNAGTLAWADEAAGSTPSVSTLLKFGVE